MSWMEEEGKDAALSSLAPLERILVNPHYTYVPITTLVIITIEWKAFIVVVDFFFFGISGGFCFRCDALCLCLKEKGK